MDEWMRWAIIIILSNPVLKPLIFNIPLQMIQYSVNQVCNLGFRIEIEYGKITPVYKNQMPSMLTQVHPLYCYQMMDVMD